LKQLFQALFDSLCHGSNFFSCLGVTLFHEFGHALHGLLSNVTYGSLSGTKVFTDYVEFPSQLLENWLTVPEVLLKFAVNQQGKKTLPRPLPVLSSISSTTTGDHGFSARVATRQELQKF
jgi:Zn-dependent oligopeptidase